MKILIDTNIILDVLLKREPHYKHSQLVLLATEKQYIHGYVSASAITDIFYVTYKALKSKAKTYTLLKNLVDTITVAAVDCDVISGALELDWDDFEDCVQYLVGESVEVDYIVTRNPGDFINGDIKTISPETLLNLIAPEQRN